MPKFTLIVCLFIGYTSIVAQDSQNDAANHSKENLRKKWQSYTQQIQAYKKIARSSYSDEQARQKPGDCPQARSTLEIVQCLGTEVEKTTANYRAYVQAIRSTEALPSPDVISSGRGLVPLTAVEATKEFDEVELPGRYFKRHNARPLMMPTARARSHQ